MARARMRQSSFMVFFISLNLFLIRFISSRLAASNTQKNSSGLAKKAKPLSCSGLFLPEMLLRGPRCIRLLFWRFPSPKQYSQANLQDRQGYKQAQSNVQYKQQSNKNGHRQNRSVHPNMLTVFRHGEGSRCALLGISSTGFHCETVKLHQNWLLSLGLFTFYPYFLQKSIGRIR